jgi:hypothetical protein
MASKRVTLAEKMKPNVITPNEENTPKGQGADIFFNTKDDNNINTGNNTKDDIIIDNKYNITNGIKNDTNININNVIKKDINNNNNYSIKNNTKIVIKKDIKKDIKKKIIKKGYHCHIPIEYILALDALKEVTEKYKDDLAQEAFELLFKKYGVDIQHIDNN